VYKDVLNYSSGSISHTFGVLVPGCTPTHLNCILECIRLLCICMLIYQTITWCFSDRASWIDYISITNLIHWLIFIHKIIFSSTCFEPQVSTQLEWVLTQAVYRQTSRREWHCHMQHVYNCILLKMSTWGSKHMEENNILWINNNQSINLVINI